MATTIRVSRELHERLSARARDEHVTLAEVIEHALDRQERAEFWNEVRRTMVAPEPRARIAQEAEAFGPAQRDGLGDDESWDDIL
jgi:predicted transcriptional regulator